MNTLSIIGRIPKGKRQPIFSRGSRACQHATSPLCRPTLGGSAAKRCCTNLVHTIGHHKNLPTSEVTQWHEQSTSYLSVLHRGRYKSPHNHRRWPRTITNSCQSSTTAPSRLGGGNHQEQQANPSAKHKTPSASRCNHSSNALGFSLNLTKMMNQWWRWVGGLWLSSHGCYVNANGQENELEPIIGLK